MRDFAIGDSTNLPTSKSGVGAHLEARVVAKELAGRPATFNRRTHTARWLAYGKGTFVMGTYDTPTVRYPPTRLKHLMKLMFGRLYWMSLKGWLEPMFLTAPEPAKAARPKHVPVGHT